jgi:RNA recognition motif-containing protein
MRPGSVSEARTTPVTARCVVCQPTSAAFKLTGPCSALRPQTTNVYVNNLPEAAKEPQLGMLFAKIGPVGSVKIFWPRFDEPPPGADLNALQSRRVGPKSGLTGFVAFMRRPDAERAIKEFDGLDWGGSVLRVSWSKAVKLPSRPIYGRSHSLPSQPSQYRVR